MFPKIIPLALILTVLFSCQNKTETTTTVPNSTKNENVDLTNPLPSWNDSPLKSDIIAYISKVTKEGTPDFIPVEDRIATFDNDGTLWCEKPLIQELFAFYRIKKMVESNPALAQKQPFKAVIEKDKAFFEKGGTHALLSLITATHTGMTEEEFEKSVVDFVKNTKYPAKNVSLLQARYQPQLELLHYLRANGFKTFIVSGGTIEVIRSISYAFYGIPKDQVVGSSFKYKYNSTDNSILRNSEINHFNDKEGKPEAIQLHIGQRPVFACGNEGGAGDIAMLKYSQGSKYPSFQLLVNHNDSVREFEYQEKDNASLNAAAKNKWHVIDMKKDWKTIFASK